MKINPLLILTAIILFSLPFQSHAQSSDNWTHFRGSELNGIASDDQYPLLWNDSTNVLWNVAVDGRGWSSPVVFDEQVWITNASPDGKVMNALGVDLQSGEVLFTVELFKPEKIFRKHSINSYATPTSAIEDGFVYVHFGRYGTACINTASGKKVWERTDMQCEHIQGPGSSLFLYEDKLIVHMEGTDVQDIYALDKKTGETIWIAKRDPSLYSHPQMQG